jgi:hypothetical protein
VPVEVPQCATPSRPPTNGPMVDPPNCSPCPNAPQYVVCAGGFCAGAREPPELSFTHDCKEDSDCVAAWVGGCCSCPNVLVPLSRVALGAVERTCAAAPCSASRASTNGGYGPACESPKTADQLGVSAACTEDLVRRRVCTLRSADGGAVY